MIKISEEDIFGYSKYSLTNLDGYATMHHNVDSSYTTIDPFSQVTWSNYDGITTTS